MTGLPSLESGLLDSARNGETPIQAKTRGPAAIPASDPTLAARWLEPRLRLALRPSRKRSLQIKLSGFL
jgi:hypothetical protein